MSFCWSGDQWTARGVGDECGMLSGAGEALHRALDETETAHRWPQRIKPGQDAVEALLRVSTGHKRAWSSMSQPGGRC